MSFIDFGNALLSADDSYLTRITPFKKFTPKRKKELLGRMVFLETKEFADTFSTATHMVAEITGWNPVKMMLVVQAFNHSGEKDGPPLAEQFEDLWQLPSLKTKVVIKKQTFLTEKYNTRSMTVDLTPIITTPVEGDKKKKQVGKKKRAPVKVHKKKKPLDKVTVTSSSELDIDDVGPTFTLAKVLASFTDPRCDLFVKSLEAELIRFPDLANLTPADAARDPPDVMFGGRRKGYYKCPSLCRVWTLIVFRWLRSRGEYFVKWCDAAGNSYDGTKVLAHAFCLKYFEQHKPGMSVTFSKHGYLKSTSHIFRRIKRQVHTCHDVHI